MAGQPRASDLFRRGTSHTMEDPDVGAVTVYVRKLRPFEFEKCHLAAGAAQARVLAVYRDTDSDEAVLLKQQIIEMGDDPGPLAVILATDEVNQRLREIEAELAGEKQWEKDGYREGLITAWVGSEEGPRPLKEIFAFVGEEGDEWREDTELALDPADVIEARRVFSEMKRFNEEFTARASDELESKKAYYESIDLEHLRGLMFDLMVKDQAMVAWTKMFEWARMFHATRQKDNHDKPYFANPQALEDLDEELRAGLKATIDFLAIDPLAGKDSPPPPSSSQRSDSPDAQGESGSSSNASAA